MIQKDDFLNWYFENVDITDYVKQSLLRHGTFSIQVHELFEEVGFLPYKIVCNPLSIDELDLGSYEIDLEKYKVELI
jgi:hypothetical protein